MKRWIGPLAVLLVCAGVTHAVALVQAPAFIMSRAMATLAERGVALHGFTATPRVTPQSQQVVRSSPDLYYALCRYDLGKPGTSLAVRLGASPDYQSLAFFDAQTDNFATLRGTGRAVNVRLLAPRNAPEKGAVVSPTTRGVILVRRLAPNARSFAAAAEAGNADQCRLVAAEPVSR